MHQEKSFLSLFILVVTVFIMLFPAGAWCGKVTVDDDGFADYATIQSAIDGEPDGTVIKVMPGTYAGFVVANRANLKINGKPDGENAVIVSGPVTVSTYRGTYVMTIGVVESTDIEVGNFAVQAGYTNPFTIAYFNSTGKIKGNDVGGNTGNSNPGNGIAAFGISSPGEVHIEMNFIHDYGKIGILVNSWDPTAGAYVEGGIYAKIEENIIVGTDLANYYRVQDGIQVTNGGSARIEKNDISGNAMTGGSYWTCDGIMLFDAYDVVMEENDIYGNQMGICIQKYVHSAKSEKDIIQANEWGIYTWNWIQSDIEVENATIKYNEYGWMNWDTNGIVFNECNLTENVYGIYASAWSTEEPTAIFNYCNILYNTDLDVGHDSNILIFHGTNYGTYANFGGGVLIED